MGSEMCIRDRLVGDKLRPDIEIDVEERTLVNKNNDGIKLPPFEESDPNFWIDLNKSSSKFPVFKEHLWNVCIATACHEPILLIGPTSFKSHLITTWCKMNQRDDIELILCNEDTESADLLGRLRPYSDNECLNLLLSLSKQFYHCLLYTSPSPRDGLLSRMPSSA